MPIDLVGAGLPFSFAAFPSSCASSPSPSSPSTSSSSLVDTTSRRGIERVVQIKSAANRFVATARSGATLSSGTMAGASTKVVLAIFYERICDRDMLVVGKRGLGDGWSGYGGEGGGGGGGGDDGGGDGDGDGDDGEKDCWLEE